MEVNRAVQIGYVGPGSRARRAVSPFYNVQRIHSRANAVAVVVLFTQFESEGAAHTKFYGHNQNRLERNPTEGTETHERADTFIN